MSTNQVKGGWVSLNMLESEILKKLLINLKSNPAVKAKYRMPDAPWTLTSGDHDRAIAILDLYIRPQVHDTSRHLSARGIKGVRIACSTDFDYIRIITNGMLAYIKQLFIPLCDPDYEEQIIQILLEVS